ncbi:MAG: 50S ribosomal protein L1, partial [Candidatus Cloacimonadota bacterium]
LHIIAGKVSFPKENLKENILAIVGAVLKDRQETVKGTYMKSAALASSMSPGIKLDVQNVRLEVKK